MAIDPDVQNELDARDAAIVALEDRITQLDARMIQFADEYDAHGPHGGTVSVEGHIHGIGNCPVADRCFGPDLSIADLNETAADLWATKRGGHIIVDGHGERINAERPIEHYGGVHIQGIGRAGRYGWARTVFNPLFSHDALVKTLSPPVPYNSPHNTEPWSPVGLTDIVGGIRNEKDGLTLHRLQGGNDSAFVRLVQQQEYETFIEFIPNERAEGQYSRYYGCTSRRNKYGLKGNWSPDTSLTNCSFYGSGGTESIGIDALRNSIRLINCSVQFYGRQVVVSSAHFQMIGGAIENYARQVERFGHKVGPQITLAAGAQYAAFAFVSFANLNSGTFPYVEVEDGFRGYASIFHPQQLKARHLREEHRKYITEMPL